MALCTDFDNMTIQETRFPLTKVDKYHNSFNIHLFLDTCDVKNWAVKRTFDFDKINYEDLNTLWFN